MIPKTPLIATTDIIEERKKLLERTLVVSALLKEEVEIICLQNLTTHCTYLADDLDFFSDGAKKGNPGELEDYFNAAGNLANISPSRVPGSMKGRGLKALCDLFRASASLVKAHMEQNVQDFKGDKDMIDGYQIRVNTALDKAIADLEA